MTAFFRLDISIYTKKIVFYVALLLLMALGFFIGSKFSLIPDQNVFINSTYSITQMMGLLSMICIFIATPIAANVLFREKDTNFSSILYSTPIKKSTYILSRFCVVFCICILSFLLITIGYASGHIINGFHNAAYVSFNYWHYLQPLLLIAVPNAFFCSAIVCSVGWLSKNKLLVYISGLFIYISYWVVMIYTNSPLMAGSMPVSAEVMNLSAKFDPFGLSAFFQQTNNWSVIQRNNSLVSIKGNMLFNRLFFITISFGALYISYKKFRFSIEEKRNKTKESKKETLSPNISYKKVLPKPFDLKHNLSSLKSFVIIDLKYVIKSIPFLLIILGFGFYLSMEIYGYIDKGIRLPENYATTGLIVNTILQNFPGLCLIVLLFYSNELIWRGRISNFSVIENTTPVSAAVSFFSRWFSLSLIIILLTTWMILVGIIFQILYKYPHIDLSVYLGLYYLVSLPLILSAGLLISIHSLIKHKFLGLAVSSVFIMLTATSLGKLAGITHPLLRFQSAYTNRFSEMNHWGDYLGAFNWQLIFGVSVTLLAVLLTSKFKIKSRKSLPGVGLVALVVLAIFSGGFILNNVELKDERAKIYWQQSYEKKYRKFQEFPQPTVIHIKANVDLYPENNTYKVSASYTLLNNTNKTIDSLLIYIDNELTIDSKDLKVDGTQLIKEDDEFGHYWVMISKPLLQNGTREMRFVFSYSWNGFKDHHSFNAIVENGSFMRISNYFPKLGYQSDNELKIERERQNHNLGAPTPLLTLSDARSTDHDFINLDMTISTNKEQTAIGVGELIKKWQQNNRNYFHYKTTQPIPFRFAISSAKYAVQKTVNNGVTIEVYYHPSHFENVAHLIENAKKTLNYCENNFGKYPYQTIRFAEVSAFTSGFNATAYPATIFMTEDVTFHANIKGDKQQDVINELAGHELAHEWWGNNQISPDNREGAKFLTESLAMYTELMLVKNMYGDERLLENVKLHTGIYLSERGFSDEQPLYKAKPKNTYLYYSKGLVVMYQLSELIGEEKVNLALRNFLEKHSYPNAAPIATDFLDELYKVCDISEYEKIDDLFKRITTYEFKITSAESKSVNNSYDINFELESHKFYENGLGKQTETSFNDTVEVAFYFEEIKKQIVQLPVIGSNFEVKILLSHMPTKIEIDSGEKFIKLNNDTIFYF